MPESDCHAGNNSGGNAESGSCIFGFSLPLFFLGFIAVFENIRQVFKPTYAHKSKVSIIGIAAYAMRSHHSASSRMLLL